MVQRFFIKILSKLFTEHDMFVVFIAVVLRVVDVRSSTVLTSVPVSGFVRAVYSFHFGQLDWVTESFTLLCTLSHVQPTRNKLTKALLVSEGIT